MTKMNPSLKRILLKDNGQTNHVDWHWAWVRVRLSLIKLTHVVLSLVFLPAGRVSVPNVTAYEVSVGDVEVDLSLAEIAFDVPKTAHPIVIYGTKQLNLPDLEYNSTHVCPSLTVQLKTGDVPACEQMRLSLVKFSW